MTYLHQTSVFASGVHVFLAYQINKTGSIFINNINFHLVAAFVCVSGGMRLAEAERLLQNTGSVGKCI